MLPSISGECTKQPVELLYLLVPTPLQPVHRNIVPCALEFEKLFAVLFGYFVQALV
jgi:hypothetical protein